MPTSAPHSRRRWRSLASLGAGACLAFALASACRDRDPPDTETSPAVRALPPASSPPGAQAPLRFAVASMISPASTYGAYEEILQSLATDAGRRFSFVQRRTYKEVNDLLLGGQVDLAFVCSGAFAALPENADIEILALPVVADATEYHSHIIVRTGEGIASFTDLRGKRFAFTDPLSNTGYYYPLARLADLGETPGTYFASTVMTGSHDRSIAAVHRKLADGAAVDSLVYDRVVTEDSRYTDKLTVIEVSPAFPMPPVVAPTKVPAELRQSFKRALLTMHTTPEGQARLAKIGVSRFVAGDPASYSSVRDLAAKAQKALAP